MQRNVDVAAERVEGAGELLGSGLDGFYFGNLCLEGVEKRQDLAGFMLDGLAEIVPGLAANTLHGLLVFAFPLTELFWAGNLVLDHPGTHLDQAIELLLPGQAVGRLVALVAAGGGVTQGLGALGDVHQAGDVILAGDIRSGLVNFQQGGIIPGADGVDIKAAIAFLGRAGLALEAFQDGGDVLLDHLELVGDGDAVAVIENGDDRRCLQHADGVDRFPEQCLRRWKRCRWSPRRPHHRFSKTGFQL